MKDYICDEWQKNVDCDTNRKEFIMHTTNSLNNIEKSGDDLFFEVKKAYLINGGKLVQLYPAVRQLKNSISFFGRHKPQHCVSQSSEQHIIAIIQSGMRREMQ